MRLLGSKIRILTFFLNYMCTCRLADWLWWTDNNITATVNDATKIHWRAILNVKGFLMLNGITMHIKGGRHQQN